MTRDEYLTTKNERDVLKEEIISLCEYSTGHRDEYRQRVEKLLTLTRVLDRAAAFYAQCREHGDIMSFLPDGREIDYQNGD